MRGGVTMVLAVAVLGVGGCRSQPQADPSPSAPTTTAEPDPPTLATYDTEGVAVSRSPFCDRVSPTGIERALADTPASHRDYGNGDRIRLPDGTTSISHEYGCEWRAPGGVRARAWIFAPPVTRARAGRLVEEALAGRCSRTGTGQFGTPSVGTRCRTGSGVETSWRGLFGDAWLTCTVSGQRSPGLEERVSEWCVSVLEAARA